jgi:hypothetical protein
VVLRDQYREPGRKRTKNTPATAVIGNAAIYRHEHRLAEVAGGEASSWMAY